MQIRKTASAGTLESNDVLVTVDPGDGIQVHIESVVLNQFGDQIRAVAGETLANLGVTNAVVRLQDMGALDCTIAARVEAAVRRAGEDA